MTDRKTCSTPSGLVVVDKPYGWTSHQVVGRLRRIAGTRKVGHAGTLDPMATGVLLVGIERATRLLGQLALTDKTYTGTIRLGASTITDDAEGDTVETRGAAGVSESDVLARLPELTGDILQAPTAVSAIKVNGVRSYARVRAGEAVELPKRPVRVDRFELTATRQVMADDLPMIDCDIAVDCSTGTYIRALARDLGAMLGTGGHLTALRRTRVGPYRIEHSQTPDQAAEHLELIGISRVAADSFPSLMLTAEQATNVRYGRRLPDLVLPAPDRTAVFAPDGQFLALYRTDGPDAVPEAVFV